MTPRELKLAFHAAANLKDPDAALRLATLFRDSGWWIWEGRAGKLMGGEILRKAAYDGHCQICDRQFPAGEEIRWSAGSCAHVACWDKMFSGGATCQKR
jgi:hypothetical protein